MAEKKIIRKRSKKKKGKSIWKWFLGVIVFLFLAAYVLWIYPFWGIPFNSQRHGNPPITPPWALECWLWEDDVNTAARVDELLQGYADHDIPVRTILLDSPWSTRYNDFTVDTTRYPHPKEWFAQLQNRGYRVVLWMTCMVNSYNKDTAIKNARKWYEQARRKGFLAGDGFQVRWWKGKGGFVDYTNPLARKWWHGLQNQVFNLGIDGWKLDGTATYFFSKIGPIRLPYQDTFGGLLTTRGYIDWYYREEYRYGKKKNPDFVTLARAIDGSRAHPEGCAPIDVAPVTWVGDQEHKWRSTHVENGQKAKNANQDDGAKNGIEEALQTILQSAKLGYNVIGSDVAGYSGRFIPPRLYIRWAEFSTFCGLFLNGGHGERALWKRSAEELRIIRKFSWLHTELVPYMFHYVVSGHEGGRVLQKPVKGKYEYLFGDDFLVAPIWQDTLSRPVTFPPGTWRYFFDDARVYKGGQTVTLTFPLEEFPVFVKEGTIVPLKVSRAYTGLGDETSADFVTYLIYPGAKASQFTLVYPDGNGRTTVSVKKQNTSLWVNFSGVHKPHILRIFAERPPKAVSLDGQPLTPKQNWWFEKEKRKLVIRTNTYGKGVYKIQN